MTFMMRVAGEASAQYKDRIEQVTPEHARIDSNALHFSELNDLLRTVCASGSTQLELVNVNGQRCIGTDLPPVSIDITGCAGNNLGAFMNGCDIVVHGNCQDGAGNTMNDGTIVVHGHSSDTAGFAMRGGKVFIRDDSGYRCGIHMKEYKEKIPLLVVGGVAHDFLGEYMAGGVLILLNRAFKPNAGSPEVSSSSAGGSSSDPARIPSHFIGTGMHGGVMYLRGTVEDHQLGKEVAQLEVDEADRAVIRTHVNEYARHFGLTEAEAEELISSDFVKLKPVSHRPYGKMYAY